LAAVIGRTFDFDLWHAVSTLRMTLLDKLDEGQLDSTAIGPAVHELVRQTLLSDSHSLGGDRFTDASVAMERGVPRPIRLICRRSPPITVRLIQATAEKPSEPPRRRGHPPAEAASSTEPASTSAGKLNFWDADDVELFVALGNTERSSGLGPTALEAIEAYHKEVMESDLPKP
jgi:hypothetical protein